MTSNSAIGGFLEFDPLTSPRSQILQGILLNSGRACLEYAVTAVPFRRVHLPAFLCQAIVQPLESLGIDYSFYQLDEQLEIREMPEIADDDLLVYINYFGVKNSYSRDLAKAFGSRILLDCSQAYFFRRAGSESVFYSPRKFFGVPDGGILQLSDDLRVNKSPTLEVDLSYDRTKHLLLRAELGPEAAYSAYQEHEAIFDSLPMRSMSNLTRKLLERSAENESRTARTENFSVLHNALGNLNLLRIDQADVDGPSYYPLKIDVPGLRRALIDSKIFVPLLWPPFRALRGGNTDSTSAFRIVPLPVDHRYRVEDMEQIAKMVNDYCLT